MDMSMGNESDQMMFLELARKSAEDAYNKNPIDTDNLVRWATVLLELCQFQSPAESNNMISEAESKLEEALEIDPKKHEAMWYLGNALTTHGFITSDVEVARTYFQKAVIYFQQANEEDPGNEAYMKSLAVSSKAPELHAQIHMSQQMGEPSSFNPAKKPTNKNQTSDFAYDVMGWICLAVGIVVWVGFAKNNMPPQPPM